MSEVEVTAKDKKALTKNEKSTESNEVKFESFGLPEPLLMSIKKLGWERPTEIQQQCIPYALQGKDIIGLAKTGSGKTGAFAMPIISELLKRPQKLFACVMAPTRELAVQISEQFEALGIGIGLQCCILVGGLDSNKQTLELAKRPHVIIGTPGRIAYHLENTKGFHFKSLRYLVLDEADRLLDLNFEEAIIKVLSFCRRDRHTYLFSATMTNRVSKLQRASLRNPVKVEVSKKYDTVDLLEQNYLFIPERYRDYYLVYLLNEFAGSYTIIFINLCSICQRVALMLTNLGFSIITIHGKIDQTKRLAALSKFKSREKTILVATDVAARGIDIPDVDLVINYEIPESPKEYIHRVGRTARAGKAGRAINLVTQYDVENYKKIEEHIGRQLNLYPTEEQTVLVVEESVSEARKLAAEQIRESGIGTKKRKVDAIEGKKKNDNNNKQARKKQKK